jgi:hypothetical protein
MRFLVQEDTVKMDAEGSSKTSVSFRQYSPHIPRNSNFQNYFFLTKFNDLISKNLIPKLVSQINFCYCELHFRYILSGLPLQYDRNLLNIWFIKKV